MTASLRTALLLGLILLSCGCKQRNSPIADALLTAESQRSFVVPFSQNGIELTEAEAYGHQDRYVKARIKADRDELSGYKIAYASENARVRANLKEPIYGQLTASMRVPDGGSVIQAGYRRFAAEAEVAVVIGRTIDQPLNSVEDLLPYLASVHTALDLPDFPFGGDSSFTATDMIAANAGAYRYALGPGRDPLRLDPAESTLVLSINRRRHSTSPATAAMGGPYYAVLWLQAQLVERGQTLKAGQVVLTGAPARAYVQPDSEVDITATYTADAGPLGSVNVVVR